MQATASLNHSHLQSKETVLSAWALWPWYGNWAGHWAENFYSPWDYFLQWQQSLNPQSLGRWNAAVGVMRRENRICWFKKILSWKMWKACGIIATWFSVHNWYKSHLRAPHVKGQCHSVVPAAAEPASPRAVLESPFLCPVQTYWISKWKGAQESLFKLPGDSPC